VNVRPTVFYPLSPGINYLTVRGLTMRHAATNWAPPTAEQIGLLGTHWSKGWIIEDCTITHSRCVGITLGKYGDDHDNTSQSSANGHLESIQRAARQGWNRDLVGSHIVRNNTIAHCEQAGLVGSLGAIFSEITGNTIHDIHVHRLFTGAEMAGIKLHGPIDTLIADNHIYRTFMGIWLDWQTQGTRIARNVCHDNVEQDLFVEVNHGPFVVDHNVFLSNLSIFSVSQGGTFAHNLLGGKVRRVPELGRETPWMPEHSTEIAGIGRIDGGDERWINNLMLLPSALRAADGKIDFIAGAKDKDEEKSHQCHPNIREGNQILAGAPEIEEREDGFYLHMPARGAASYSSVAPVTTKSLGITAVSKLPFKNYDGAELNLDADFFQTACDARERVAGPFARARFDGNALKVANKMTRTRAGEKVMLV
jgi:alpha-N-arabinofuranosidase